MFGAFGAALSFTVQNVVCKSLFDANGVNGITSALIFMLIDGIIGCVLLCVFSLSPGGEDSFTGNGYASVEWIQIFIMTPSALMLIIGVICLNVGLSKGNGGLVLSLANSCILIQTLADYAILGQPLVWMQLIGVGAVLIGVLFISMPPESGCDKQVRTLERSKARDQ